MRELETVLQTVQGIREKLLSAQRHDSPRWGDYPEKTQLPYLEELIRQGAWFDGSRPFIPIFRSAPTAPSTFSKYIEFDFFSVHQWVVSFVNGQGRIEPLIFQK
jgi:hypothetical protein